MKLRKIKKNKAEKALANQKALEHDARVRREVEARRNAWRV